jgi:hypothetical protein
MGGSGQNDQESRRNRLEAATELMIRDNEEFRERFRLMREDFEKEHKRLLIAQVVMADKLEKMQDGLQETRVLAHEIGEKLNGLLDWSNQVHRDNDERFRRLEEKH